MRASLTLDPPPDSKQPSQYRAGLRGRPSVHAATKRSLGSKGTGSPCSMRSAITRNASAVVLLRASASVLPYANTPGSSGTSPIHRPSSSRSISILSITGIPSLRAKPRACNSTDLDKAAGNYRAAERIIINDDAMVTDELGDHLGNIYDEL